MQEMAVRYFGRTPVKITPEVWIAAYPSPLHRAADRGRAGEIYNLAGPEVLTVREIVAIAAEGGLAVVIDRCTAIELRRLPRV